MNRERLEHLIVVLEGVKKARQGFYMGAWAVGSGVVNLEEATGKLEPCGSACCAMGYAALDPVFMKEGLRLRPKFSSKAEPFSGLADFNAFVAADHFREAEPLFEGLKQMDAAEAFFDLSENDAYSLFSPEGYRKSKVTPTMVITKIRALLDGAQA